MPEIDHPHTDPGDGRVECSTCGKWVHLVTHSCKRVPVTARARLRQQPTRDVERGAAIIASLKRDTATTEQAPIRYIRVQINRDNAHTIVEFFGGGRACSCGLERGPVPSLRASHPRGAQ